MFLNCPTYLLTWWNHFITLLELAQFTFKICLICLRKQRRKGRKYYFYVDEKALVKLFLATGHLSNTPHTVHWSFIRDTEQQLYLRLRNCPAPTNSHVWFQLQQGTSYAIFGDKVSYLTYLLITFLGVVFWDKLCFEEVRIEWTVVLHSIMSSGNFCFTLAEIYKKCYGVK